MNISLLSTIFIGAIAGILLHIIVVIKNRKGFTDYKRALQAIASGISLVTGIYAVIISISDFLKQNLKIILIEYNQVDNTGLILIAGFLFILLGSDQIKKIWKKRSIAKKRKSLRKV